MKKMLGNIKRQKIGQPRLPKKHYLWGFGLLVSLASLVGCSQGSYPLDIFYEMHYQESFKVHEPPRLSVPASAVGWFPAPKATSFTDDGQHLYQVNCSMCHGQTGQGDGPVLQKMKTTYDYQPVVTPDLTSDQVMHMELEVIMSFMGSGLQVMPNFSKLLTEDEMRLIAHYVVNCIQGKQPQACP